MVDTYYDKMDRGAVPRLPGYSGYVNTLAGQTPGMQRFQPAAGTLGAYGSPRRRSSQLDALLKRTAELQKQANDANQSRYDEGRRLLGLPDPDAWRKAGFASEDAYNAHQDRLAAIAAGNTGPMANPITGTVGAQGGPITPEALASRVQAKQRGIYNSSTALNQEAVTNSLALRDADVRARTLALNEGQLAESKRRADMAETEALRRARLEWIYNRNDQAPNLDRVQQVAATEGTGTTEGMSYPTASGGGGGGGGAPGLTYDQMRELSRERQAAASQAEQAALDAQDAKKLAKAKTANRIRDAKTRDAYKRSVVMSSPAYQEALRARARQLYRAYGPRTAAPPPGPLPAQPPYPDARLYGWQG